MKVCHITTVHPPQDARIFYRMCRGIAAKEIQVVLVAPGGFPAEAYLRPSPWNERIARASRPLRALLALRAARAENADVYHFHDPELIPLGLSLKSLNRPGAVIYDVHEDYPSMMRDKYWLPRGLRSSAAAGAGAANRLAARFLDGIVTADEGVAADFRAHAAGKTLLYYNFPVLSLFTKDEPSARPKADLVYVGGLSARAGTFVFFDALQMLAARGIRATARLAGYTDGVEGLARIESELRRRSLTEQVEFHGRIPHDRVPEWLSAGRIGLVMLQAVPKFMKNIPSKMFEYWACGLPVVASDLPPIRRFLVDGENGSLFSPSSAPELAERIAALLSRPDCARALGDAGRRRVEADWNNERQIEDLVGFYSKLAECSAGGTRRAASRPLAERKNTAVRERLSSSSER